MPSKAKSKLNEKRAEQADLKRLNRITVTLEASEQNLQRIAALLTFSSVPYELEEAKPLGPLPWEDPNDPRYQKPPELEIDWNKMKNEIVAVIGAFVTAGGDKAEIRALLTKHGGESLNTVPQDNLQSLLNDLNRLNHKEPK